MLHEQLDPKSDTNEISFAALLESLGNQARAGTEVTLGSALDQAGARMHGVAILLFALPDYDNLGSSGSVRRTGQSAATRQTHTSAAADDRDHDTVSRRSVTMGGKQELRATADIRETRKACRCRLPAHVFTSGDANSAYERTAGHCDSLHVLGPGSARWRFRGDRNSCFHRRFSQHPHFCRSDPERAYRIAVQ